MREFENQLLKRASRWRAGPLFGATALLLSSVVSPHAQESARQQHTGDLASFVAEANAVRDRFKAMGIEYGFVYTSEVLGNVSGGLRRGAIYDGKLDTTFQADLGKLAGWEGLTFYANVFQLHGTGRLKAEYTGAINTNSNIEALQTTRLSELWLEQKFAGGAASLRFGQLAADQEFFFSDYGNFFVNSDWPTIAAENLPSGGPAYPLSTPGVRLKIQPSKDVAWLLAVFNGDPAGPGPGDPQRRNRYGLNFRVQDPPLIVSEVQISRNQEKTSPALASALKFGMWGHVGHFDDQRFDTNGVSLASPSSTGSPFRHRGNYGIYGIVDQQLYRPAGGDASSGLVVFTRISASPSDRNLVDFYVESGTIVSGLVPGRPDDKLGASVIYSHISDVTRALAADEARLSGTESLWHSYEATLEVSYQAQLREGWVLQPMFQYVWHPAAVPGTPNATVVGIRSVITY